ARRLLVGRPAAQRAARRPAGHRADAALAGRSARAGEALGGPAPAGQLTRELLAIAEAAAREAGALLLDYYGGEHAIRSKSTPTDLVSEADLASERLIRGMLRERAPDDGIVGE